MSSGLAVGSEDVQPKVIAEESADVQLLNLPGGVVVVVKKLKTRVDTAAPAGSIVLAGDQNAAGSQVSKQDLHCRGIVVPCAPSNTAAQAKKISGSV
jgi:hypothetical protein